MCIPEPDFVEYSRNFCGGVVNIIEPDKPDKSTEITLTLDTNYHIYRIVPNKRPGRLQNYNEKS